MSFYCFLSFSSQALFHVPSSCSKVHPVKSWHDWFFYTYTFLAFANLPLNHETLADDCPKQSNSSIRNARSCCGQRFPKWSDKKKKYCFKKKKKKRKMKRAISNVLPVCHPNFLIKPASGSCITQIHIKMYLSGISTALLWYQDCTQRYRPVDSSVTKLIICLVKFSFHRNLQLSISGSLLKLQACLHVCTPLRPPPLFATV